MLMSTHSFFTPEKFKKADNFFLAAQALCETTSLEAFTDFLQNRLPEFIPARRVILLVSNPNGNFRQLEPTLPPPALGDFSVNSRLGRFLARRVQPFTLPELAEVADESEYNYLVAQNIFLVLPLVWDDCLYGILLLEATPDDFEGGRLWLSTFMFLVTQRLQNIWLSATTEPQAVRAARHERFQMEIFNRKLLHAREEERKRFSRDLHDGVVQDLLVLQNDLAKLMDTEELSASGSCQLAFCSERVSQLVQNVRAICTDLRPRWLDYSLVFSLTDLVRNYRRTNPQLEIKIQVGGKEFNTSEAVRLAAYRITQEAITNALKHAQASKITVVVRFLPSKEPSGAQILELNVLDNGRGFEQPASLQTLLREGHLGLVGVYEQVADLRGELHLYSTPGGGTRLSARFPLKPEK